jgi:hypothetical protein
MSQYSFEHESKRKMPKGITEVKMGKTGQEICHMEGRKNTGENCREGAQGRQDRRRGILDR